MKKIIINIILFIFIWFAGFTVIQSLKYRALNTEFVACAKETDTENFYKVGNVFGQSVIYKANSKGKIIDAYEEKFGGIEEELLSREIVDVCYADDVYYLVRAKADSGNVYYKMGQLSKKLQQINSLLCSDFEDSMVQPKLNIVDKVAYLTLISADHREVSVYAVKLEEEEKVWNLLSQQSVSEGRYFVEAIYTGNVLQAGLDNGTYVYYQADEEYNLAEAENLLKMRQDDLQSHEINMSSLQILLKVASHLVLQNLILAILCMIFVIALYLMFNSRSYALKQFALIESVMLVMITCSIIFCMYLDKKSIEKAFLNNVEICFDFFNREYSHDNAYFLDSKDYYNSADYGKAYDELADFSQKTQFIKEIMLVHVDGVNRQVMVSLNAYRTAAEEEFITIQVEKMLQEAKESSTIAYDVADIFGSQYGVYVVPLQDNALVSKYIVSFVSMDEVQEQSDYARLILIFMGAALMAVVTAAAATAIRYMTKDIKEFSMAMMSNTEEAVMLRKPAINNNEVEFMWNSLAELTKRYEKVNYTKYLVLQAYYRFAPRKIETILGKNSILDVEIGDKVHIDATIAMISLKHKRNYDEHNYMDSVYRDFEVIGKSQVEEGGVIINMNSSLTYLKMMFLENDQNALKFGINIIQAFSQMEDEQERNAFILLHRARFIYGVSGNSEQTFPFTVSEETEALDAYIERFQKIDAGLIVTESVKLTKNIQNGCRYIGYIFLQKLQRYIKLYQVLDAYPVSKRNRYLASDELFQSALKSFYENDFYIARNAFTDVIKSNPSDEIARWYLFTCEQFLNAESSEEYEYALFAK